MSKPLSIGLICEGTTDLIMLQAIIKSLLGERVVQFSPLQPEVSAAFQALPGTTGLGWPGVYRWCLQAVDKANGPASAGPVFESYDLVVVQLDADVADSTYSAGHIGDDTGDLPCRRACPPASATTDALRSVALRWLQESAVPNQAVLCTPSKSLETWLLVGLYPEDPFAVAGAAECRDGPERLLASKPLLGRLIRSGQKQVDVYRERAPEVAQSWHAIRTQCTEAARFEAEVVGKLASR